MLGLAKKHCQAVDERNKSLLKEVTELRQGNQVLLRHAEESERSRRISMSMVRDLERKLKDSVDEKSDMTRRLESSMCELENLKQFLSENADKVSALEISCSSKEGIINHQVNDLRRVESLCAELGVEVEQLKKECEAANQEVLFHQQISEQHSHDLTWLLKQGVHQIVRSVLNSEEFGNMNGAL